MEKYSTTGIRQMKKSVYHICLDSTLFVICRDDLFLELDPFSVLAWFIRINSSQCPKKIFERYLKSLNLETHLLSVSANGLLLDLRCYSGTLAFFSPHYNTAKGLQTGKADCITELFKHKQHTTIKKHTHIISVVTQDTPLMKPNIVFIIGSITEGKKSNIWYNNWF